MPNIDLHPNTVVWAEAFTSGALASVLGNTTAYATHTGSVAVNGGLSGRFYFPMADIPAGATVNSITASVIAKASATARRSMYAIDLYGNGGGTIMKTLNSALGTTDATYSVQFTGANLTAVGWTSGELRDNTIEWTATFLSTSATSTTTSWQKFWLTVDYSLATTGANTLFLGENF